LFLQVKSDAFVQYDNIAQKMCQASISRSLYPVATTPSLNTSFLLLREVAKKYFAISGNLLYPEQDFEQELSGIALEQAEPDLGESADESSTCRKIGANSEDDVYEVLNGNSLDPAVSRYCQKGIVVGKRLGHTSPDAAVFAAENFADHFANIVAGISFAYAFCNAEHAVGSLPLSSASKKSTLSLLNVCSEWAQANTHTSDVPPELLPFLDPSGNPPQLHANA
jgi:hypothetical protein